jgi:hypothetical protein
MLPLIVSVAMLLTPYVWAYDQVLLVVPILAVMLELYRRKAKYFWTSTFPLLMTYLAAALLFLSLEVGTDAPAAGLPMISFAILSWLALTSSPALPAASSHSLR